MFSKIVLVSFAVMCFSCCASAEEFNNTSHVKSETKTRDCTNSYTATCIKLDLVSWVDKLNEEESYIVFPGVSVVRDEVGTRTNTGDIVSELAREFPNDPDARLDAFLLKKITSFLSSHSVRFDLLNKDSVESGRGGSGGGGSGSTSGGSGGGKKGGGGGGSGGGGMGTMMLAGAMMKGTMLALAFSGIAAIAGKALLTGLISLLVSAIIGIKALTSGKQTTYEIVTKPVYTHSASHSVGHEEHHGGFGHSSYGRSFDVLSPTNTHPDFGPQ